MDRDRGWLRQALASLGALALVALLGSTSVSDRLPTKAGAVLNAVRTNEFNRQDAALLQKGYYEKLMGVGRANSRLWEVYMNRPKGMPEIWDTPAGRRRDDYIGVELVPSQQVLINAATMTTNRWAMRDRDYEKEKPAGTLRLAIAGPSVTMGWGVHDDETFENLVEDRLNKDRKDLGSYDRVEILNFSVPGFVPVQEVVSFERALEFGADVVMLFASDNDVDRMTDRLAYYALNHVAIPGDSVAALVAEAAQGATVSSEIKRRLFPHGEAMVESYYRTMVEMARARGARPVWVFMPALERTYSAEEKEALFQAARAAGFEIVDMSDVYAGQVIEKIVLGNGDFHPNPDGHRIIAARLMAELRRRPELLRPL